MENSILVDSANIDTIDTITIQTISPALDSLDFSNSNPKKTEHRVDNIISVGHFGLNHLSVEDRDSHTDSLRLALFDVDLILGTNGRVVIHLDEYRQKVEVDSLTFSTEKSTLGIGNLFLIHKLGRYTYTGLQDKRMSWIEIVDAEINVKGMDFNSYFRKGMVEIDSLSALNLQLSVFTDKRKAEDLTKRPPMFHESVNNLGQIIHTRHIYPTDSYLRMEERPDNNGPLSGVLFFTHLNAEITNISNYKEEIIMDSLMVMKIRAKLMDISPVDIKMSYDLTSENGDFALIGTLGKMPLRILIDIRESGAKISLKLGVINRFDFNIVGNDYEGNGEAIVRYEALELELLNKE